MSDFRNLLVWQKGMELVTLVYSVTTNFPLDEQYSLTSQIRRCSISIPSNIAEGTGKNHKKELVRYLEVFSSSLNELQTQLEIV